MKILIVIIIAFLAAFYVFTFVKWKKRKKKRINSVADFNEKYVKNETTQCSKDINDVKNMAIKPHSNIDYIDKETFLKDLSNK